MSRMLGLASLALAVCLAGGCSFGAGSAYVGQWRARDEIEYRICVEDEAGRCTARKDVVSRVGARRFWGALVTYPAMGFATVSIPGRRDAAFMMALSAEYLRGRGDLALGLRVGTNLQYGLEHALQTFPVTALGHLGLSERFAIYGGAGPSPHNRLVLGDRSDDVPDTRTTSWTGVQAVAGLRTVLSRAQETRIVVSLEGSLLRVWFDEGALGASGLLVHLGMFI
jgi:hypothetical protein